MSRELYVDGKKFSVVNSELMLLKMLKEYLQLVEQLPAVNSEAVQRLVEILQMFNSISCHLVLGAGAKQFVQLKSITAKHLGGF